MAAEAHDTSAPIGVDVLGALRRYWPALVLAIVLLVGGAVALGLRRPAKYTSTATLQVGHVYVSNPAGVSTIIESTQTLAGVYSRTIHATSVQQDVAQRLKRASVRVSGALSATPLPSSPLIKVTAQATSAAGATALANAGASALQAYVNHQVRATDVTASLTKRYQQAALAYRRKKDTSDRLERRYRLHPTKANRSARDSAGAATDGALLAVQALQSSYQQAVERRNGIRRRRELLARRAGHERSQADDADARVRRAPGRHCRRHRAGTAGRLSRDAPESAQVSARASAGAIVAAAGAAACLAVLIYLAPAGAADHGAALYPRAVGLLIAISVGYMVCRLDPAYTISAAILLSRVRRQLASTRECPARSRRTDSCSRAASWPCSCAR